MVKTHPGFLGGSNFRFLFRTRKIHEKQSSSNETQWKISGLLQFFVAWRPQRWPSLPRVSLRTQPGSGVTQDPEGSMISPWCFVLGGMLYIYTISIYIYTIYILYIYTIYILYIYTTSLSISMYVYIYIHIYMGKLRPFGDDSPPLTNHDSSEVAVRSL